METETKEVFYDKLTYIYLEMPKFTKEVNQLETHFEKWLYVLKNLHRLEEIPKVLQERIFKKLFSAAEVANYNPEEMTAYEESLKTLRDNHATAQYVEEAVERAVEETEERTKEETIGNLLKLGILTHEQIAESVKVPVERVHEIAQRHQR